MMEDQRLVRFEPKFMLSALGKFRMNMSGRLITELRGHGMELEKISEQFRRKIQNENQKGAAFYIRPHEWLILMYVGIKVFELPYGRDNNRTFLVMSRQFDSGNYRFGTCCLMTQSINSIYVDRATENTDYTDRETLLRIKFRAAVDTFQVLMIYTQNKIASNLNSENFTDFMELEVLKELKVHIEQIAAQL